MNITMLPAWADAIFIIAIVLLAGLSLSKKINLKERFSSGLGKKTKTAYYIMMTIMMVVETVVFFYLSPMKDPSWVYFAFIGVISFLAFLVSVLGSGDADDSKKFLLTVGGIYGLSLVLISLIFCNFIYAAIWMVSMIALGFIGYILFPNNK